MHMGVDPTPKSEITHKGYLYDGNQGVTMPYGREADGQWEEVGSADMESGLSYEFDQVTVFRHRFSGGLLIAHDSGCSCPMPFENTTVKDGKFLSKLWDFDAYVAERADKHGDTSTLHVVGQVAALRKRVEAIIMNQHQTIDGTIDVNTIAGQRVIEG